MEDVNQSGSNGKKRRRSKANTANQEDPNGPQLLDKDGKLRDRRNQCWIEVENLICDAMDGDSSIRTTGTWEGRKKKVKEANKRLQDPLVILRKLRKVIAPSITGNTVVETALLEVESFLKLPKNPVTNQEYTDGINGLVKTLQDTKEELQFYKNQLMQENIICDHKKQLVTEAKAFGEVSKMLNKMSDSCCGKMYDILSLENPVQEHFVQIEDEQLLLHFPPPPDSTKINQLGENAEIYNSRMIDPEEPEKEVGLVLAFAGDRLAKLTLKMQNNDRETVLPALLNADVSNQTDAPCNVDNLPDMVGQTDWGEGTDNSRKNEANVDMSYVLTSMVRSYCVNPSNAEVLTEIVQKHPDFDKKFQFQFPYFQSIFMNALAVYYHNLKSNPEMYELDDIKSAELVVKDMELTGLESSCLKKKIELVREMLKNRLQEELDSYRAKEKETEQKLAMLL